MTKYPLAALLVLLAAACSDQRTETSTSAKSPAAASATPAAAVPAAVTGTPPLPQTLTPTAVPEAQIPAAQRLPGKLTEAWRWQDANGENLLVVYLTGPRPDVPLDPRARNDGDDGYQEQQQQLAARQYVRQPGQPYRELWHLRDEVRHCAFDLDLALLPHTTTVTDLDHDGQTETTLLYFQECRSDVSPDDLKLILHEGTTKYALRGYTVVQFDSVPARQRQPAEPCCLDRLTKQELRQAYNAPNAPHMGRYFNETDFRQQPEFLRFARQQWQRYSVFDAAEQAK
ncbi:MAG: M949_RS01915 family surface polysaccharide biosynthesis protein [Janthinobacterium lividum]